MRILAIDPGERHLGAAVCDPGGVVARPLTSFEHTARAADAARIAALAAEQQAELIVIGLALDARDDRGPQARRAERLADAVRLLTTVPVELHDESYSSREAQQHLLGAGKSRRARREQIHAVAAAEILQSYLDARPRA
jgi:putative Holliday junction resolvase